MCGIIAAMNLVKAQGFVNRWCTEAFEDQCSRGMKGFGIVAINEKGIAEVKRSTEPAKFMYDLHAYESNILMVHHRIPTSTENKIKQTHPILVANNKLLFKYLVIHNGVISNDTELFEVHKKEGFKYTTYHTKLETRNKQQVEVEYYNDSEALAIELALTIDNLSVKKEDLKLRTFGSAAFIVMQLSHEMKPLCMYWGRNEGNPLTISLSQNRIRLASEGNQDEVEANMLFCQDLTVEAVDIKKIALEAPRYKPYIAPAKPAIQIATNIDTTDEWEKKSPVYGFGQKPSQTDDWIKRNNKEIAEKKAKKDEELEEMGQDWQERERRTLEGRITDEERLFIQAGKNAADAKIVEGESLGMSNEELLDTNEDILQDASVMINQILDETMTSLMDPGDVWKEDVDFQVGRIKDILEAAQKISQDNLLKLDYQEVPME